MAECATTEENLKESEVERVGTEEWHIPATEARPAVSVGDPVISAELATDCAPRLNDFPSENMQSFNQGLDHGNPNFVMDDKNSNTSGNQGHVIIGEIKTVDTGAVVGGEFGSDVPLVTDNLFQFASVTQKIFTDLFLNAPLIRAYTLDPLSQKKLEENQQGRLHQLTRIVILGLMAYLGYVKPSMNKRKRILKKKKKRVVDTQRLKILAKLSDVNKMPTFEKTKNIMRTSSVNVHGG